MGISTITCRLRDAEGREFDHTFTVSNLRSDGHVTEDEIRLAVPEILRQGLPPGTTLVRDEFIIREGVEEGSNWLVRTFGSAEERTMTGLAPFFRPQNPPEPAVATRVIQLPTIEIRSEVPTVSFYDLPQVDSHYRPIPTVSIDSLPQVDEHGRRIPTVNIEDLPLAPGSRPSTPKQQAPVASRASRSSRVRS